jgi:hypothetical protein
MATSVSADQAKLNDLEKEYKQLLEKRKGLQKELNALDKDNIDKRKTIIGQIKEINQLMYLSKTWQDETNASIIRGADGFRSIADTMEAVKNSAGESHVEFRGLGEGLKESSSFIQKIGLQLQEAPTSLAQMRAMSENSWIPESAKARLEDALNIQGQMMELQSQMAGMSAEDGDKFKEKLSLYTALETKLAESLTQYQGESKIAASILTAMMNQNEELNKRLPILKLNQALTKDQKEELEEQLEIFKKIKNGLLALNGIVKTMFGSITGFIGVGLIALGKMWHKFHEISEEIGVGMMGMMKFKTQLMLTGAIFGEKGAAAAKELAKQMGNVDQVGFMASLKAGYLANHLGISGQEAATLSMQFGKMQGESVLVGQNTAYAAAHLAEANNVMPNAVMEDLAKNTEVFAKFSAHGGYNMIKAAVQAAKLGVSVEKTAGMAEHLLDFENSINEEMEASAMLGREVNFQRARELAFQNDIEGATKEMLRQVGGINEFNNMNLFQRQAIAKAMGVEVSELQTMLANQEQAQTVTGKLHGGFTAIGGAIQHLFNNNFSKILEGMGAWLVMFGHIKTMWPGVFGWLKQFGSLAWSIVTGPFRLLKALTMGVWNAISNSAMWTRIWTGITTALGSAWAFVKNAASGIWNAIMNSTIMTRIWGAVTWAVGGAWNWIKMSGMWMLNTMFPGILAKMAALKTATIAQTAAEQTKNAATAGGAAVSTGANAAGTAATAGMFSRINTGALIKGAFAILILAGALYVAAKGFQEFGSVEWGGVAKGLVGLAGIAVIAMSLGGAASQMVIGAAAIALLGLALIPAAYAFSLLGGVDAGSILAFAASIAILSLVVTGLGALIAGPGALVFGAGILGLLALGGAIAVMASILSGVQPGAFQAVTDFLVAIAPAALVVAALAAGIFMLGTSIMFLATSLIALGAAGILSAPGLLALMAISAIAEGLGIDMGGIVGGGGKQGEDPVLLELQGLRADLAAGKIAVHMDGMAVSRKIFKTAGNSKTDK